MANRDKLQHSAQTLPEASPPNTIHAAETLRSTFLEQLNALQSELDAVPNKDRFQWDARLQDFKKTELCTEHIIGVIGTTGAGKSALINAVLDEDYLVPTSCMQACTATVIEIAYNRSDLHKYRAVVHFVSRHSWQANIDTLLKDAADHGANFRDDASEASIAFSKLSSVYTDLDKHSLSAVEVSDLLNRPFLDLLGTTVVLTASSGLELYKQLQKYVESKKRSNIHSLHGKETLSYTSQQGEYWPLVEKVQIFTKSPTLETGCILVDLPGIGDINAARSSIAKDYLLKCARLWILVPIIRAIDDKVARSLLGESLRRQLRRDGTLDRVTFICSKADDILLREMKYKFMFDGDIESSISELHSERTRLLGSKAELLKKFEWSKRALADTLSKVETYSSDLRTYEELLVQSRDLNVADLHIPKGPKRGRAAKSSSSRKRSKRNRVSRSESKYNMESRDKSTFSKSHGNSDSPGKHLMESTTVRSSTGEPTMSFTDIHNQICGYLQFLEKLDGECADLRSTIALTEGELASCHEKLSSVTKQEWYVYYQARNHYVSEHIRADFRLGIEELEQDDFEADDNFDPAAGLAETARGQLDLLVFCVSSRGFQKLNGKFSEEDSLNNFTDLAQTGIPHLMQHCIDIGEKSIVDRRTTLANQIGQLLTSMKLWLSRPEDDVDATSHQQAPKIELLTEQLAESIVDEFQGLCHKIDSRVTHVVNCMENAARAGYLQAPDTVRSWGAPRTADIPGLRFTTYRAVLRRAGKFNRPEGKIDWIDELLQPMMRHLDDDWNHAFNILIPGQINTSKQRCSELIKDYLKNLDATAEFKAAGRDIRVMFSSQFKNLVSQIQIVLQRFNRTLSSKQAVSNRLFEDEIQAAMRPLCAGLADDAGVGVFKRIKDATQERIEPVKKPMFENAARKVSDALRLELSRTQRSGLKAVQQALDGPLQDCRMLFSKATEVQSTTLEKDRANLRQRIRGIEELLNIRGTTSRTTIISTSVGEKFGVTSRELHVKNEASPEPEAKATLPRRATDTPVDRTTTRSLSPALTMIDRTYSVEDGEIVAS